MVGPLTSTTPPGSLISGWPEAICRATRADLISLSRETRTPVSISLSLRRRYETATMGWSGPSA